MKLWPYVPKFAAIVLHVGRLLCLMVCKGRRTCPSRAHTNTNPPYMHLYISLFTHSGAHTESLALKGQDFAVYHALYYWAGAQLMQLLCLSDVCLAVCYMTYSSYMGSSLSSGCVQRPLELGGADLPSIEHAKALAGGVGDGAVGHVDAGALREE